MSAKVRVALLGALLLAAGVAAVVLWPRSASKPPTRQRVFVVIVDRWEAGFTKPDASGDMPSVATSKVVESLHREPGDSLLVVRYSRTGGYTRPASCTETIVGARAGWPVDEWIDRGWEQSCVRRGLERAASYLAWHAGADRRIVIISDGPKTDSEDVDALIARLAQSGITVTSVVPDDVGALRAALR